MSEFYDILVQRHEDLLKRANEHEQTTSLNNLVNSHFYQTLNDMTPLRQSNDPEIPASNESDLYRAEFIRKYAPVNCKESALAFS